MHTKTPWQWDEPDNWMGLSARICTENYEPIAQVQISGWPKGIGQANAEFICRCVNSHDKLIEALEAITHSYERMLIDEGYDAETISSGKVGRAREALALAKEPTP